MPIEKDIGDTGAEHYIKKYSTERDINAEWLRLGAAAKVDSIELLLKQVDCSPQTILELGTGTGAIIEECMRRGIGRQFFAVDYSLDSIEYLKNRHKEFLTTAVSDITKVIPFEGIRFDVVILSHVLEHLERPDFALKNAINRCKYLIAEVPLEDLPFAKFRWLVRRVIFKKDRNRNLAGHVQFFTRERFRELLSATGWNVVGERLYVPCNKNNVKFMCKMNRFSYFNTKLSLLVGYYLPQLFGALLWSRAEYAHYAIIAEETKE